MLYRPASPECSEVSRCTKIVDKWRWTYLSSLRTSLKALYKWSYQKIQIQHIFPGFGCDSVSRSEFQTLFEGWHLPFGPGQWCDPWSKGFGRDLANGVAELWRGGAGGEGGTGGTTSKHQNAGDGHWGRISHNKMARVQTINTKHRSFLKKGVSELDAFQWRKTGHNKLFVLKGKVLIFSLWSLVFDWQVCCLGVLPEMFAQE